MPNAWCGVCAQTAKCCCCGLIHDLFDWVDESDECKQCGLRYCLGCDNSYYGNCEDYFEICPNCFKKNQQTSVDKKNN